MEIIKFHFHRKKGIISKIIQWKTGSRISHVSIEVRGWYYHALANKRFFRTQERFNDIYESLEIEASSEAAKLSELYLTKFLGSLYDYKSIFGFMLNEPKQSNGRVYCSEIANTVLEYIIPGEVNYKKLISPEDIRIAIIYYNLGLNRS